MSNGNGQDLFTGRALKYSLGYFGVFVAPFALVEFVRWFFGTGSFEFDGLWIVALLSLFLGFGTTARELHSELNRLHEEYIDGFVRSLDNLLGAREPRVYLSDDDIRHAMKDACAAIRRNVKQGSRIKSVDLDWQLARMGE